MHNEASTHRLLYKKSTTNYLKRNLFFCKNGLKSFVLLPTVTIWKGRYCQYKIHIYR